MKKLLITLLSVLMIVSIGVANVAAEEGATKASTKTATVKVLLSEDGLDRLGTTALGVTEAKEEEIKATVPVHQVIDGVSAPYYYLEDLIGAINAYVELEHPNYKFLMFADHYYSALGTASKWSQKGIESGKEYRWAVELSDCYAVLVNESKSDETGFVVNTNLVYNGKAQSPFIGTPHIDKTKIFYTVDGVKWSEEVPTFTEAGEHTFWYRLSPNPGVFGSLHKVEVTIKKFELTDKNTVVTFKGADTKGEKVTYEVKVDGFDKVTYIDNGTDTPKTFGENTLVITGVDNFTGYVAAKYNVGHVADRYVKWNGKNWYNFQAEENLVAPLLHNYTVKTTEGFVATAVEKKGKLVCISRKPTVLTEILDTDYESYLILSDPKTEKTYEYNFILGNVGKFPLDVVWESRVDIDTAKLHVLNSKKPVFSDIKDNGKGNYVYEDGSVVNMIPGSFVKSVVVPTDSNEEIAKVAKQQGIEEKAAYDIYLLYYEKPEAQGVRVEPANGKKVAVTIDSPYTNLPGVANKHERKFYAIHDLGASREVLNVKVSGDKAEVTADHFSVFSFGYKDVKVSSNKKDRKYEPVKTSVED